MIEDETREADEYVRDQLLIQWLLNHFCDYHVDVEDVYDEWKAWIDEREAEHAKRSTI